MPRKDKNITPSVTNKLQSLGYDVADWDDSQSKLTNEIKKVFSTASKSGTGYGGYPDRIYISEMDKLLIVVEEKPDMNNHNNPDPEKGAISGIKSYLNNFLDSTLKDKHPDLVGRFKNWKIIGIAVSGDLAEIYKHKFSSFYINMKNNKIEDLTQQISNFVTKKEFLSVFNTIDQEKAVSQVSKSSKVINDLLRDIDSQKRPILLSALMICLHKTERQTNEFPNIYKEMKAAMLADNIIEVTKGVLEEEGIPENKLKVLETELAFLRTEISLRDNSSTVLKDILDELNRYVIPLFDEESLNKTNYDIIGKFYEEFLKYAGVSNVKKGIVLTPRHITTLFTKLIDINCDDRIVDLCCGTGAFLIAGMNRIIDCIKSSEMSNKEERIKRVKGEQLLGFEKNSTMYICAISNMLFRGDGKSSIFHYDSINDNKALEELKRFKPTIGFINPPYGGKENKKNNTPKEITFLQTMLDNCGRYGIIIAPFSTFSKDDNIRENILKYHTLKMVINMPKDLFLPNAMTHTAIAVFETHKPFDYVKDKVQFYDLKTDGLELSKNKGRTDVYNKWSGIEKQLLDTLQKKDNVENCDEHIYIEKLIKKKDEWNIYAHTSTDYSNLSEEDFVSNILDYVIFKLKQDSNLIGTKKNEIEIVKIFLNSYDRDKRNKLLDYINKETFYSKIDVKEWKDFLLTDLFEIKGTLTTKVKVLEEVYGIGDFPYVTTKATDNGVAGYYDYYTEEGNVLTIDSAVLGYVSYQERNFTASDHVELLKPKRETILNVYTALFIKTMIMIGNYKYDYGRKFNQKRIKATTIKLPVCSNGKPDWDNIEKFMRQLPYGELL